MNQILQEIRSRGLNITAENDQILVTPKSLITYTIRQQIKSNKPDLLKAQNDSECLNNTIADTCSGLSITT